MKHSGWRWLALGLALGAVLVSATGCRAAREARVARRRSASVPTPIRRVVCIYSESPWLNLDAAGDRDPEGVWYYAYLSTGSDPGVLRDGTFKIEMYRLNYQAEGTTERTLECGWSYPTNEISTIGKPGMMGQGYVLQLMWTRKDTAGRDIELVTVFEDEHGRRARAETKSLRVPKYSN